MPDERDFAEERDNDPKTVYEDTEAHERIGFRKDDATTYGTDSIDYEGETSKDAMTKKEQ